jgi:hypothetical protein
MILCSSRRGAWGIDLRGYLGARDRTRVLGRWKVVERRTLVFLCEWTCNELSVLTSDLLWTRRPLTPFRAAWAAFLA